MVAGPHLRKHRRRGRRALAALSAPVLFLVLFDQVAGAQVDPGGEGASSGTEQAPSIGWTGVLWAIGAFAILGYFVWRVGLPAVRKAVDKRRSRVAAHVAGLEAAEQEAEVLNAEYTRRLADAAGEAERIIAEGRDQAARIQRDMELDAERELARLREQAASEIEATRIRAIADVQAEAAELATAIADELTRGNRKGGGEGRGDPAEPPGPTR